MHVALLTSSHAEPYRALMLEAYAAAPEAFTSTPEERAPLPLAWWEGRLAASAVFGAFEGERLVGTVALVFSDRIRTRHVGEVAAMYVRPEARRCGAGRALLDALLDHARARPGLAALTLTVTAGNAPALALYRAAGFEAFGTQPMAVRGPSGYLAKVHMWRPLAGEPLSAAGASPR